MPLAFNRPTKKHNSYIPEARAAIQMFLEAVPASIPKDRNHEGNNTY
jgi:hypothetical protein